ncbi:hypothetical protein [Streptomyces phytophilus]|uniref:hypothetical protein n=1 Tax=Streptomyces phytophilus TaxID=722715 RepID=UPI0015EFF1B3|nr:hypothetical protein [Streptomyces phytophilus]
MKPFNFQAGDQPWQTGTLLHWYADVDVSDRRHDALRTLVTTSNTALLDAGFPITPVPPQCLHITIDQISVPADRISPGQRDELLAEGARRFTDIEPLHLTAGSLLSYHSGVIADLANRTSPSPPCTPPLTTAPEPFLGNRACRYNWGLQHLTTAYAHEPGRSKSLVATAPAPPAAEAGSTAGCTPARLELHASCGGALLESPTVRDCETKTISAPLRLRQSTGAPAAFRARRYVRAQPLSSSAFPSGLIRVRHHSQPTKDFCSCRSGGAKA